MSMTAGLKEIIRTMSTEVKIRCGACVPSIDLDVLGKTMVIAPHPDDEVLGCGGLIARLVNKGNAPHIAILTSGEGSHRGCCRTSEDDIVVSRRNLAFTAAGTLGAPAGNYHFIGLPDGSIPGKDDESKQVKILRNLILDLNPDTVFVPHWGEGWPDHLNAARLVRSILREEGHQPSVYEYAVWMWYYFVWRLDWRNAVQLKMRDSEYHLKCRAVDEYVIPQAPCGRPWSGVLPDLFISANKRSREIYFKTIL